MLQLVTGYYKGYGLSAKPKIIHRFMPREKEFGPWIWELRPDEGDEGEEDDDEAWMETEQDERLDREAIDFE
ncbi:hypothetical protein H2198_000831 [Neophaeococcomyces mojaviensis]|uniref:Uncharacterized protein n=1 Tax=Neophaeococcomyces mojaviensis TaxID=3383035 RepID=A0ACC3AIK8_9EURO|nr:hypothetical protein H2198_000831 [Knufia sp. JES_112]